MMNHRTHYVAGNWLQGSGPEFSSTNPADGEIIWEGHSASMPEVVAAISASRAAFEHWAERPIAERHRYLEAFGERLKARQSELAEVISLETGKPRWESLTEVRAMIGKVALSVTAYDTRCRTVFGELGPARTVTRYKPHGVAVVLGPFNFPGHLPNGHIVPALLAGNTVVFKPSRQTPLTAIKTLQIWEEAGLPPGVLNLVHVGRNAASALIEDSRVAGLFFTGGMSAGRALHRAFSGRPEVVLALEMGGNNPLVVCEVEDLDAAAYYTVESAFISAGQRCSCARRLIVPRGDQGDEFIQRLAALMKDIRVGAPNEKPEPFMGPVISVTAAEALLEAQDKLAHLGGRSIVPMERLVRPGSFLSPGLMDVTGVSERPDEEYFGPFLQLIRVRDFDDAIREANNTAYGLAAGLLSDQGKLYDRFQRKVRAGVINWNRQTTGASGTMPFGGVGASGNHRPSAFFAADYCAYPIASIEREKVSMPPEVSPGISRTDG